MLKGAVQDNIDTIKGRLPRPRHRSPQLRRPWSHRASFTVLSFGLIVAAAAIARWSALAQTASVTSFVRKDATVSLLPQRPDPSLLSQPVPPDVLALGVRRVIVDAGHGGENLGTSGANGLFEKDLTLDIAARVRQLIVTRGFDAVMTRTANEMLSLRQRAAIANARRGDIFVSIHLNSLQPSSHCGVETYYMGPSNDPEGDAFAAVENEQSGYPLSDMRSLLEKIYTDARRDESRRLAEAVQHAVMRTLRKTDPALSDRGVKMAPFVVLIATEMPAILAEVSCLSNAAEARRLSTAQHRQTLAEALVSGIETFVHETREQPSRKDHEPW
jgi:N-acetylmuramoyl-L-alanine amidase